MKLSVIIPTYNRAALLARTLNSVLGQTRPADEIIVVDDGSTDNTREVVASYGSRVTYCYQRNAYQGAARNTGQARAAGDCLCFLDSDDLLLPAALMALEKALTAAPEAALAYCRSQTIDENGAVVEERWQKEDHEGDVWHPLIAGNFIRSPGAALIRRSHLSRVGLWDPAPEIRGNEDWDMWIRLAESGPFVRVEEPLFQYRVHGSSMSTNEILRLHWSTLFLYRKHLQCNQKDPERLCRVAHAYQKANKQTYKRWLAQAYADRSRGDARAALAKAARVLGMHPGYLLDKDFIRFFLGTWKRAWKMSPVPHPPRSSGAAR